MEFVSPPARRTRLRHGVQRRKVLFGGKRPPNKKPLPPGGEDGCPTSQRNPMTISADIDELTSKVINAAIEVHKSLGPGLLESAYEECLCREFDLREIKYERQKDLPVQYKGITLNCGYRLDMVVEGKLIVELKACSALEPIHEAQLLTYLKLAGFKIGLLINFNVPVLRMGIRRIAN